MRGNGATVQCFDLNRPRSGPRPNLRAFGPAAFRFPPPGFAGKKNAFRCFQVDNKPESLSPGAPVCSSDGVYLVAVMNSFSPVGYCVTPVISGMQIQVVA